MVMIACALLWAMTLPEAPQGLKNSQQTMLISFDAQAYENNSQGELLESWF
jgi:hypothetical protein